MEKIEEFKYNVKNNKQRKNFFINKFKNDLKRLNIRYNNNDLERLLIEAINSYNDVPNMFSSYGLNYIKEKLQVDSSKPQKNNIFSEEEMIILNLYLSKDKDGNYLKSEEIATKLGINVFDVTQAVHKLKQNTLYNYNETSKIFNGVKKIISDREHTPNIKKIDANKTISDEDIEIIGLFTGQINDICLDIEEIAQEKNTSTTIMRQRIEKIYGQIYNQKNYLLLTKKYPNIDQMLRLKGKSLGITLPKTIQNESTSNKTPTTNELQKNNINKDIKPKIENSNKTPTTTTKSKQKHQTKNKETSNNKIINDCKALKYIYKKQDNGTYLSTKEIASLLNINESSVYNKRRLIMDKLKNDKDYKKRILKLYPELYNDIEMYKKKKVTTNYNSKIEKDIKILKYFYKKQDNGTYLSTKEIADKLNIELNSLYQFKYAIKKKLREDLEYKNQINKKYPELNDDINKSKQKHQAKNKETSNNKIINDCKTLKYIYKKQDNGTYLSTKEIATLLNINENSVYNKRRLIMDKLKNDKDYKKRILKVYPELYNDIEMYEKNNINASYNSKIEKDIKILKYFYKKQDNGTYLSTKEIADKLNVELNSLYKIKSAIKKKLREDLEYKDQINKKYPELNDDIQIKKQISKADYNKTNTFTKNERLLLDKLYIDKTRAIKTKKSYCEKLNISTNLFDIINENLTTKLVKNKTLKNAYPNFEMEKEIITNYFNIKSITLSENEFINIKNNSRKYDIPNYKSEKSNLLKGIELLEKSNYSDYISLCTYEQKTMLALRFGYFNNTLYSTGMISNLFNVSKEEISILTKECIKTNNKQKIKVNN